MKAFLLAGGRATRLRPVTDSVPKCLVPIRGVPILQIWLDICALYNIDQVLLNVYFHGGDVVRKFLEASKEKLRVRLVEEKTLLGSAGTILSNRDWIAKEECFWILYADVLTTTSLSKMLAFHESAHQMATIGVYEISDPSRCGIVRVDEKSIVSEFVEKPKRPASNLAFSGLMLASPNLMDAIPNKYPVDLGFHVLPQIVGRMAAYRILDFVLDIGTLSTYEMAQQTWPGLLSDEKRGGIVAQRRHI